ncbi:MAG: OmpA family protein [Methylococcaceae bacterium]|nr:OmpA family protein [Methylococcaceae bacterium]
MKIQQYWIFCFCSVMPFASYSVCLSEFEAKALYFRSQAQTAADSEHLLKRSAVLCENYDVYYELGLNQQKLKQYSQSLESFVSARQFLGADVKRKANLFARMANSYLQLNDLPNAIATMEAADKIYATQQSDKPEWANYVSKDIAAEKSAGLPKVSPKIDIDILFDPQSMLINEKAFAKIKELGSALLPYVQAGKSILIVGHSEKTGDQESNLQLSEDRAKSVVALLEALYPDLAGRLSYEGRGYSQLRYQGNDKAMQALNRRVAVEIR